MYSFSFVYSYSYKEAQSASNPVMAVSKDGRVFVCTLADQTKKGGVKHISAHPPALCC